MSIIWNSLTTRTFDFVDFLSNLSIISQRSGLDCKRIMLINKCLFREKKILEEKDLCLFNWHTRVLSWLICEIGRGIWRSNEKMHHENICMSYQQLTKLPREHKLLQKKEEEMMNQRHRQKQRKCVWQGEFLVHASASDIIQSWNSTRKWHSPLQFIGY